MSSEDEIDFFLLRSFSARYHSYAMSSKIYGAIILAKAPAFHNPGVFRGKADSL